MRGGILTTIVVLLITLSLLPQVSAVSGCSIMTGHGLQPDYDCDGIIDEIDNCPWYPNSQQEDINRNGVGDYCDLLIEEIVVNPDTHVRQGEFATLTVRLINNRDGPLTDISVEARNRQLGLETVQEIPYLPAGESAVAEFWFRIPKCQDEGSYAISITTELVDPLSGRTSREVQSERIIVEKSNVCGTADGPLDGTIIEVLESADIDRGNSAVIPINVVNMGDNQATYHFSVESLGSWGTWRVDPAPSLSLPAGNDGAVYLYLDTESHTPPGKKTVNLIVASDNQQTRVPVEVYVRAPAYAATGSGFFMILIQWLLVFALLLLIIAAIFIAVIHMGKGPKKQAETESSQKKQVKKSSKKTSTKKAEKKSSKKASKRRKVAVESVKKEKRETYY